MNSKRPFLEVDPSINSANELINKSEENEYKETTFGKIVDVFFEVGGLVLFACLAVSLCFDYVNDVNDFVILDFLIKIAIAIYINIFCFFLRSYR